MGALTQYYVDPQSGSDTTGTGAIGTPWKTVQKALNTITRDATNGDKVNVKAGATDTLTATLSFATYGTPTAQAPLMFRGYTATADDGGIGVISGGGGAFRPINTTLTYIWLVDMRVTNAGVNQTLVTLGASCAILRSQFDTTSGSGGLVVMGAGGMAIACYFTATGWIGLLMSGAGCFVWGCYCYACATYGIQLGDARSSAIGNVIDAPSGAVGIVAQYSNCAIVGNTIYSAGGGTYGIMLSNFTDRAGQVVFNNIIQGFTHGILCTYEGPGLVANNAFRSVTNARTLAEVPMVDLGDLPALAASPFVNAAGKNYAIASGSPVIEAGVFTSFLGASTINKPDLGAVQLGAGAGGGGGPVVGSRIVRGLGVV